MGLIADTQVSAERRKARFRARPRRGPQSAGVPEPIVARQLMNVVFVTHRLLSPVCSRRSRARDQARPQSPALLLLRQSRRPLALHWLIDWHPGRPGATCWSRAGTAGTRLCYTSGDRHAFMLHASVLSVLVVDILTLESGPGQLVGRVQAQIPVA